MTRLLIATILFSLGANSQTAKPKILTSADLPRFQYPVRAPTATALLQSKDEFDELASAVRKNDEQLLSAWDIQDRATLRQIHSELLTLDMLEGKFTEARKEIGIVRELEDKPSSKAFSGLFEEALLDAHDQAGSDPEKLRKAFFQHLQARLNSLDWEVVKDPVKMSKGRVETASKQLFLGLAERDLGPQLRNNHALSGEGAGELVAFRFYMFQGVPLKNEYVEAANSYIAAHKTSRPEIWQGRAVALTEVEKSNPVRLGVWDTGVDLPMFQNYRAADQKHVFAAWDFEGNRSPDYLMALSPEQLVNYKKSKPLIKGLEDLTANVDSKDAGEAKRLLSQSSPAQITKLWEDLALYHGYLHGTHVAGIVVSGNPFARLVLARVEFEWHTQPRVESVERARRWAQQFKDTVRFLQEQKVRAVNMSWAGTLSGVEENLAKNGVGKDPADRKRIAQERFLIGKTALYEAIKSAPEILFICAAANNGGDSSFTDVMPSSFDLPNLLTVGAVDNTGDEVGFTNYGPTVKIYANGYEVMSTIPGNDRMLLSGTSMASPQVTNLAGKLLALDPTLTPTDVIQLILDGGAVEGGRVRLMNPKRSVELLKERKKV